MFVDTPLIAILNEKGKQSNTANAHLRRSMEALNRQAMRILKLFGNEEVKCVRTSVGPEQEYFLVPKELYEKRKDLIFTCGLFFAISRFLSSFIVFIFFSRASSSVELLL